MRNSKKLFVGLAAAGLVATGATAFTATNTLNGDNVAGYGQDVVSGVSTSSIVHTLSADGANINSTALTFVGAVPAGAQVTAGFDGTFFDCTVTAAVSPSTDDTAVCTYTTPYTTSSATSFQVVAQ